MTDIYHPLMETVSVRYTERSILAAAPRQD
jgi:hypothetical protein